MNPKLPSRIVCAAMKMEDGSIVVGVRHFSPDMRAIMKKAYGDKYWLQVEEQGFIDSMGNFLTRSEAWQRAKETNQILREVSVPGELYSENLY